MHFQNPYNKYVLENIYIQLKKTFRQKFLEKCREKM